MSDISHTIMKCAIDDCVNLICDRLNIKICEQHKCDIYDCPNIAIRDVDIVRIYPNNNKRSHNKSICCREKCFNQITIYVEDE